MTQNEMILKFLQTHSEGITPNDAKDLFGCMRLSGRIHDLRDLGHIIKTEYETSKNKFGRNTTYARYKLVIGKDTGNNK